MAQPKIDMDFAFLRSRFRHHSSFEHAHKVYLYSTLKHTSKSMTVPYVPITKEAAASILSVSKRTIDNWLADGTIVEPCAIGRRVYWHPDVFYRWLNERLGVENTTAVSTEAGTDASKPRKKGRPRTRAISLP